MYIKLVKDDDGTVLWVSPAIDPGYSCDNATLTTALPSGETAAHAMFLLYDVQDDGTEAYVGTTAVKITLNT